MTELNMKNFGKDSAKCKQIKDKVYIISVIEQYPTLYLP